jgi:uncharacterized protein (DUF1697 family)
VPRYVVLLRGVNVGGRTKVAMPALRSACESVGCTDVSTYIQSGNVVLASELGEDALRDQLAAAIRGQLGLAPALVLRSADEMAAVLERCPYPDDARDDVHVAFLQAAPDEALRAALGDLDAAPEELAVVGREIYLSLPNGMGRARLPVEMGRRLSAPTTLRNWRTVTRLVAMARS